MKLSKQTKDAVAVLVHMARLDGAPVAIPQIAQACAMTPAATFKLVPILVRAGFLETDRGRGGGVRLAMRPEMISVGTVVRRLEQRPGEEAERPLDSLVGEAFEAFVGILDRNTIADLSRGTGAADRQASRGGTS